jgi:hypothetical protein
VLTPAGDGHVALGRTAHVDDAVTLDRRRPRRPRSPSARPGCRCRTGESPRADAAQCTAPV